MPSLHCEHTCPRECQILNRILLREAALDGIYQKILKECDYPDVHAFVLELARDRQQAIQKLEQRVNAMYASYDPAGC